MQKVGRSVYFGYMEKSFTESESGRLVHQILAQSYILYLGAVIVGVTLDMLFPIKFSFPFLAPLGMFLIIVGTFVVAWAQKSARKGRAIRNSNADKICRDHFCVGPYVFTRLPTQYGLSVMALGLACVYGSFFMLITTVLAFVIAKFVFIPRQEFHLEKKYGDAYTEYKEHVRF